MRKRIDKFDYTQMVKWYKLVKIFFKSYLLYVLFSLNLIELKIGNTWYSLVAFLSLNQWSMSYFYIYVNAITSIQIITVKSFLNWLNLQNLLNSTLVMDLVTNHSIRIK